MQNICEDGYQGSHDPVSDDLEVQMSTEVLDDKSVVVNFDVFDNDQGCAVKMGGYVMVKQDDEGKCFSVLVFDVDGNIQSETHVPFNFQEC